MSFLQEQCEWVADTLKGASEKNYAVIIAAHEFAEKIHAGANDFGFCQRFMPHPWGMPRERKPNYIIEDIVDVYNVKLSLDLPEKIKKAYNGVTGEEYAVDAENGLQSVIVPKFNCHASIVLEY